MITVAILGAGTVGCALAQRLLHAGSAVRFGVRDPGAASKKLTGTLAGVPVRLPAAAAADAEILLLAVPAAAALDATRSAGTLTGKILVDCTNPLRWDGGPVWAPPPEGSVAQALAAAFPGVAVIKGFNHFGAEIQRNPALVTGPADAFFAGNDPDAKSAVMNLGTQMGFRTHDAGPLRNAGLLENLAVLWIQLATTGGVGRTFGFRIERQG
ncbi:MAG TPA: NAD(P)-binding domain-containing protein [Gemmatimonadales bacterium]